MLATVSKQNIHLIISLAGRDISARYKGSAFGILWSFINPLLLLSVYGFVFSVIFKSKWQAAQEPNSNFAIILFSGLIVHALFAECLSRAPSLILQNPSYVKKVVFPLWILAPVLACSAFFHFLISSLVLLTGIIVITHELHWTIIFLPLIILPFLIMLTGISWIFSSLGVYLRDLSQFVGIIVTIALFVSPVFYPANLAPAIIMPIIYLNPISLIVDEVRNILVFGKLPDLLPMATYYVCAILVFIAGLTWFQKTKKGFADVI